MKIEAGKFYRDGSGKKVGPIYRLSDPQGPNLPDHLFAAGDGYPDTWREDGTWHANVGIQSRQDLVDEWSDEPTGPVVTEKRIRSGIYGRVTVNLPGFDPWVHFSGPMSAADLRAAITTLTQIADALDEGATCAR